MHELLVGALRQVRRQTPCPAACAFSECRTQGKLADALHACRGTFLGAPWGPFHDVRKVWDDYFGRKSYRAHSMGIASKTPPTVCSLCMCQPGLLEVDVISCASSICMNVAMAPILQAGLGFCGKECQAAARPD